MGGTFFVLFIHPNISGHAQAWELVQGSTRTSYYENTFLRPGTTNPDRERQGKEVRNLWEGLLAM